MTSFKNKSIDDRDMNALRYSGFWFNDGSWNASREGATGTLSSSNDPNASVTFTFPEPARAVYYYGIRRSRGGKYAICLDCNNDRPDFKDIDALNRTDDGQNPPEVLWSQQFSQPGFHSLILKNEFDDRFPDGHSQIVLDRFDIEVVDDSAQASSASPPNELSSSTMSSIESSPSATAAAASSSSSSTPIGAIVGGVVGGIVILGLLFLYLFRLRRRRQRDHQAPTQPYNVGSSSVQDPEMQQSVSAITSSDGSTVPFGYRRKSRRGHSPPSQLSFPSREARVPRRETDAGRVSIEEEDDLETLPPEYDQVFQRERRDSSSLPEMTSGSSAYESNNQAEPRNLNPLSPRRRKI